MFFTMVNYLYATANLRPNLSDKDQSGRFDNNNAKAFKENFKTI